jgi:hypothetical protein
VGVHAGHRLVQHHQARPGCQRPRHLEAPLLAVGKLSRDHVAATPEPDEVEDAARFVMGARLVLSGRARVEHGAIPGRLQVDVHADQDVLDRRQIPKQADRLVGAVDPGGGHAVRH